MCEVRKTGCFFAGKGYWGKPISIHRALRPGGILYASFKAGEAEGRDGLGRYFNYLSSAELRAAFGNGARWQSLTIDEDTGCGYDRQPTRWLHALAIRSPEP